MTTQDPIADFLTQIKNALAAKKPDVTMPASTHKVEIANVLKSEGFIGDFDLIQEDKKSFLKIGLKYFKGKPVIQRLKRVSKPGCRVYARAKQLPKVSGGLGVVIVSTSQGVMTEKQASCHNLGGEVVCEVF